MYTKSGWKCCDKYDGSTTIIKMEKGIHYAKSTCAHCNHFIKWLPNPKITQELEERVKKINNLIELNSNIIERHKNFLEGIKTVRFLTPRQNIYYEQLLLRYKNIS